jgi:hypothetical protein
VTTLQVQTSQLGADRVTAIPETARDLRGALSYGPEFFEQCYVFRIPTHGRYYTPTIKYWLVVRFIPDSVAKLPKRRGTKFPLNDKTSGNRRSM